MSRSPDQVIRPEILALSAYHVPPASDMVKLDAMENPYTLPQEIREEIAQLAARAPINRYPDAGAASLKAALREALAIPDGMDIMLGNGSDEIIQIIALAFARPGAILMSVEPAFVMFRMITTFTGMGYAGVPLRADFSLDVEAMLSAMMGDFESLRSFFMSSAFFASSHRRSRSASLSSARPVPRARAPASARRTRATKRSLAARSAISEGAPR